MSDNNGDGHEFFAEGFHRLDDHVLSKKPPKIQWGSTYKGWEDVEKIIYLEKLAITMNHAAALIQDERNELNRLIILKEKQLNQMSKSIEENNKMLQSEVTRMNEQRQGFNARVADLNRQIKELKNGSNH